MNFHSFCSRKESEVNPCLGNKFCFVFSLKNFSLPHILCLVVFLRILKTFHFAISIPSYILSSFYDSRTSQTHFHKKSLLCWGYTFLGTSKRAMQIKATTSQKGKSRYPAISFSCRAMMLFFGHFLCSSVLSINWRINGTCLGATAKVRRGSGALFRLLRPGTVGLRQLWKNLRPSSTRSKFPQYFVFCVKISNFGQIFYVVSLFRLLSDSLRLQRLWKTSEPAPARSDIETLRLPRESRSDI